MEWKAYTAGVQIPSTCCRRTTLRPCEEASAEIFLGASGLYRASVVGLESSPFTRLKAED